MKTKFLNTIFEYSMFQPGQTVVVGVSGGADSMCLLHLLFECSADFGVTVEAAHLNHSIRGEEADRDELFVRNFCESKGIVFHCKKADIPEIARLSGESIELCARRIRYEFFDSLHADVIATAHTGSDRIETMLMNLSRGSALSGLCSIPAVRGNIVRPLIDITRNEIEDYCFRNQIDFVTDSTNLTDEYTRNKFRHNVITELIKINPSFEINALRCIRSLNVDSELLDISTVKYYNECLYDDKLDVSLLSTLPVAAQKRVVIKYISTIKASDFEMRHIDYITHHMSDGFSLVLPGKTLIASDGKFLFFINDKSDVKNLIEPTPIKLGEDTLISFNSKVLSVSFSDTLPDKSEFCFFVDAEKLGNEIVVRSRKSGDVISLLKRKCSKSLNKLFNEMKIPVEQRDSVMVIADENGIIYVDGIGIDSFRIIGKDTKKYMIIKPEV